MPSHRFLLEIVELQNGKVSLGVARMKKPALVINRVFSDAREYLQGHHIERRQGDDQAAGMASRRVRSWKTASRTTNTAILALSRPSSPLITSYHARSSLLETRSRITRGSLRSSCQAGIQANVSDSGTVLTGRAGQ